MIPSRTPSELLRTNALPSPASSLIGHQLLSVVRVEGVDLGGEVDLTQRLLDRLAHLADDDLGQLLAPLGMQLADAPDECRPLRNGRRTRPAAMRRVRAIDRGAQIVVADRGVLLDGLAGRGIDNLVGAHLTPFICISQYSFLITK